MRVLTPTEVELMYPEAWAALDPLVRTQREPYDEFWLGERLYSVNVLDMFVDEWFDGRWREAEIVEDGPLARFFDERYEAIDARLDTW